MRLRTSLIWLLLFRLTIPAPMTAQTTTSYPIPAEQDHMYYIDGNGHVQHKCRSNIWGGSYWVTQDLTSASGTNVLAAANSSLTSYLIPSNTTSHVYYIGANQHIEHLWFTGQAWINEDLTNSSGANVPAASGTGLNGYYVAADGSSHIYYVGSNQHIEHLWFTGSGWVNQDLTSAAGGNVLAQSGCGLNAYFILGDNSTHVYYITTGLRVEHLYFNGQAWTNQDLTAASGSGVLAASNSGLSAYFVSGDSSSHVYYVGSNQHIEQVWWSPSQGWVNQDLTTLAQSNVLAASGTDVSSYFVSGDSSSHVYYVGNGSHVEQIWWSVNQGWANQDLTALSGAAAVAGSDNSLSSYFVLSTGASHVFYFDANGDVEHLWFNGQRWINQDISKIYYITGQVLNGSTPAAGVTIQLTGDSVASTTTDANGNYVFGVAGSATYTVAPQGGQGTIYAPASATFSRIGANASANFSVVQPSLAKEYIRLNGTVIAVENSH